MYKNTRLPRWLGFNWSKLTAGVGKSNFSIASLCSQRKPKRQLNCNAQTRSQVVRVCICIGLGVCFNFSMGHCVNKKRTELYIGGYFHFHVRLIAVCVHYSVPFWSIKQLAHWCDRWNNNNLCKLSHDKSTIPWIMFLWLIDLLLESITLLNSNYEHFEMCNCDCVSRISEIINSSTHRCEKIHQLLISSIKLSRSPRRETWIKIHFIALNPDLEFNGSLMAYLSITGKNDVVESNVRMVLLPRTTIFSRVTRRIVSSPVILLVMPLRNFGPNIFISLKNIHFCLTVLFTISIFTFVKIYAQFH